MKYQQPRFSVTMPGARAEWPFPRPRTGVRVECLVCGNFAMGERQCVDGVWRYVNLPHVHGADADRPRKRICFGRA